MLFMYIGIGRPMHRELASLRQQVEMMQAGMEQLVALKPAASAASDLLGALNSQQQSLAEAEGTWRRIETLREKMRVGGQGVDAAFHTLDDLVELKDAILTAADRVHVANDVLSQTEVLQERLAQAADIAQSAQKTGDIFLALGDSLSQHGPMAQSAQSSLQRMIEVQQQLGASHDRIDDAFDRLDDLLLLKDTILSRTPDLVNAIELVELTSDLTQQFQRAVVSFEAMRKWMVEIVATQPLMEQARQVLSPLMELSNLRRLDADRVRDLAKAMCGGAAIEPAIVDLDARDVHAIKDDNDVQWDVDDVATSPGRSRRVQ